MTRSKSNMRKRNKSTNRQVFVPVHEKARAELAPITATSALGTFSLTSYVLSTALNNRWAYLASCYQRWRIKWIKFHYVSQIATTNNGRVALAVIEDADGSVPTTFPGLLENRCSIEGAGRNSFYLKYTPVHSGWLYTRDLSLNEDRLEYPGYLAVATGSFTSSGVPGYIWYEYSVEFSSPCNTETQLFAPMAQHPYGLTAKLSKSETVSKAVQINYSTSKNQHEKDKQNAQSISDANPPEISQLLEKFEKLSKLVSDLKSLAPKLPDP